MGQNGGKCGYGACFFKNGEISADVSMWTPYKPSL